LGRADRADFSERLFDDHRRLAAQARQARRAAHLLANRHILDMAEDRRHERISHRDQMVTLVLEDGTQERCAIVDLSVSGVAVVSQHRPPLGSAVRVGKAPGRVARYLDNGFAVEFSRLLAPDALKTTISP
jgi:predicted secreted protein